MFERNFKIKIKNFFQIKISMLIINRKTTDSLLFARITQGNISIDLRTIVMGRSYPPDTLKFYSNKLI